MAHKTADEIWMAKALAQAKKGRYTTRPNPCVGCVIVKDGVAVGAGFHQRAGEPHAEVLALREAGGQAMRATAYVTLEPCSHYGKTPPCCDALIQANVAKVVVATTDPNPKVAGSGIQRLQRAGIDVVVGVLENEAKQLNAGFLKAMATGLPYVRVKLGVSLDGKIAMANGQSKWITSQASRHDVQKLRAMSGAIITGSGTIVADNPRLDVRENIDGVPFNAIPNPKIVVMDRQGRLNSLSACFERDYTVFNYNQTLLWQQSIETLLSTLVKQYQCYDVLVEAGATLSSAFLQSGLVDELIVYQAPCLLGATARPMFLGQFTDLKERLKFVRVSTKVLGDDLKMVFRQEKHE